jgi:flagellar basal body-associated protein FliL
MTSWILSITSVIVFSSIIYIILPEGKSADLVKCILAIITLLVVIKPIINYEKLEYNTEENYKEIQINFQGEYLNYVEEKLVKKYSKNCIKIMQELGINDGKVIINHRFILGYTKVGKEYVIVEDEAKIVRRIFLDYLSGKSVRQICDELNSEGLTTKRGCTWQPSTILSMLSNEKYTGNAILGKTFQVDVLSKARVKNQGQGTLYYVENSHPGIISQEIYDMVQKEKDRRVKMRSNTKTGKGRYTSKYPLSGLLVCGDCGTKFRRFGRTLANGDFVGTWVCIQHQKDKKVCKMLPLKEEDILEAYKRVVTRFSGDLADVLDVVKESINEELKAENNEDLTPVKERLTETRKQIIELFKDKKAGVITTEEYNQKYNKLSRVVRELEQQEKTLESNNTNDHIRKEQLKEINRILSDETVDLFEPQTMRALLDCIKVVNKHTIEFQFKCDLIIQEYL